jgi:hypothetical protein
MTHIFISYSTRNSAYALQLADMLRQHGFDVWIDNAELRSSDNWWEAIVKALRSCAAFIVVMTPESRASKWVQREVTLADNWSKPTFPILLAGEGDAWEIFVTTQYAEVRLPGDPPTPGDYPSRPLPETFFDKLAEFAPRRAAVGADLTTGEVPELDDDDDDAREALQNPPDGVSIPPIASPAPAPQPSPARPGSPNTAPGRGAIAAVIAGVLTLIGGLALALILRGSQDAANANATRTAQVTAVAQSSATPDATSTSEPMPTETATATPEPTQTLTPHSDCGIPTTSIGQVQGSGQISPLIGQQVTVEGVVTGDFQEINQLSGFFMQEEAGEALLTTPVSTGLFVRATNFDVLAGDRLRVTGVVEEMGRRSGSSIIGATDATLTALGQVGQVMLCARGVEVAPFALEMRVENVPWERYEGMLVTFPQTLTVADLYDLGLRGTMLLSEGGRITRASQIAEVGTGEGSALQAANRRRMVVLDDGSVIEPPAVMRLLAPEGLDRPVRVGDQVGQLIGIVDHRFGEYRIQPVAPPAFFATNRRPAAPDASAGLRVVNFNIQNYFNGDGQGGGFPTERGAQTLEEFERQRAKIVSAILAMQPDILTLSEVENDGYTRGSAIWDLVNALNEASPDGVTYAYVNPGVNPGMDAIKNALVYRVETVSVVGAAVTMAQEDFGIGRPPLAQVFELTENGERLTVVVNHFKSKACVGAEGENQDNDDLQGCFNAERVREAQNVIDWLASGVVGGGDPDVLLMGDFNAYANEDPISTFETNGFTSVFKLMGMETQYTYVFQGESGYLDHILVSASLTPQVNRALVWHINADEATFWDYRARGKHLQTYERLYAPDPFRSSDHDPVLIDLKLSGS